MQNYVDDLVKMACDYAASDLFLSEGAVARIKVHGVLHTCGEREVTHEDMVGLWTRCQANPATAADHDSSFVAANGSRFRVNCHRHSGRLGAVMRLVKSAVPAIGSLGLPVEVLTTWLEKSSGLFLVTGPTGSGKSTTLAACLDWINETKGYHIVTIEDPMEFEFHAKQSFFTQREVGRDTPSFASGLRSALRQAPDVIFLEKFAMKKPPLPRSRLRKRGIS